MKRLVSVVLFCLIFIFAFTFNTTACAEEISVSAQAYVLYCVENDSVLLSKNEHNRMKVASTTKIMTTLLTLESAQEKDKHVHFDESMMAEGSSMYLKVGDTVRLSDLAVGMMMASGNDAANAAAVTVGGSVEKFADMMNKRASKIGMKNTNFVTPSGLDDENHYSTAYDMALLMSQALNNEKFCDISKNTQMTVEFLSPQKKVTYNNHNRLLTLYDYCISGKTGYTKSAGRCLVTAARKNGLTLIAVTFNAPRDWNDHIKLYDYGFERYALASTDDTQESFEVDVVGAQENKVSLYCKKSQKAVLNTEDVELVKRTVYIPHFIYAPVKSGDFVGTVTYELNGEIIAQNSLYAMQNVDRVEQKGFKNFISKIFR